MDLSPAQLKAMRAVQDWVRTRKTPVPRSELFKLLINQDLTESAIRKGISALVAKGYIRRAVAISNQTSYVQLKGV